MNAPTLIIGLGGKGSEIALRVAQMVSEEQRKQIGFAVFDTDVNELRKIKEKNAFVHTIQTSTKLTVGEYLENANHARDTWFPVNAILNSKTLSEGAGQVRAVSRMAFETAVRAGKMEELHKAIDELYKIEGEEYQQALRVIIVSSLAGGTGSGLILPVALYVKNYLATKYRQSANITRGFFILPEVFYHVIKGQGERNNLKSNAYATLKELDAFLMKGDDTLPEKYRNTVRMEFPRAGSTGYEEFDVRPYDFCFLFDAQNTNGKQLGSFEEYIEHAANCIFAQSIGPMNKRSNSSEDNTIRSLCAENGRNRYAGAGTSMLIYPTEDIKKYMALSWATEAMSKQWRLFDDIYAERLEDNRKSRRKGLATPDVKEEECYIQSVEQKDKDGHPFAKAIVRSCTTFDETGVNEVSKKWDEYIGQLQEKIEVDNESGQLTLDDQLERVNGLIGALTPDGNESEDPWSSYIEAYKAIETYQKLVQEYVFRTAKSIAYTMFRTDDENVTQTETKYRLEYYMRDRDKKFMHPNAARYFLYKTLETLQKVSALNEQELSENKDTIEQFVNMFDDPKTKQKETVDTIADVKKISLADKFAKRLSSDQQSIKKKYIATVGAINAYKMNAINQAVYEEGIKYIQKICKSFFVFYTSFNSKFVALEREIKAIENKYRDTKGMTASYVCASPVCLSKMLKEMPYDGGTIEIDTELAETIYSKVHTYAYLEAKAENVNYFGNIFDVDILDYFKRKLMESYASEIDLDVITAIEREAFYEKGIVEEDKVKAYVVRAFDAAKVLAEPFIEKPLGEERDPINSCTFNDELYKDDDSPRSRLIKEELMNFGAEPDADIAKNMILFYKSFYALRANDLSKFAPPQKSETYKRVGGEYYTAYYDVVSKIHPIPSKSKVITPHIDRWWHTVAMMPDLDEENQAKLEYDINAALFWGLVSGYIDIYEAGYKQMNYRLMVEDVDIAGDSSTLYVSNGTPCDKLYEVLDAISIYPELVTNILKRNEKIVEDEINDDKSIYDSSLIKAIKTFTIKEYPLEDNGKTADEYRSIFDLPMLLKRSTPFNLYDEEKVVDVLKVEISEIQKHVAKFCEDKEYPEVAGMLIYEQFEKYVSDLEKENMDAKGHNIFHDYLFRRTYSIVAKSLEEMGLRDLGEKVRDTGKRLSK